MMANWPGGSWRRKMNTSQLHILWVLPSYSLSALRSTSIKRISQRGMMKYQIINIQHFLGARLLYAARQLLCGAGNGLLFSVCLTIYTSAAGLSHTEGDSVGVKGSLEMGLTASLPLLYRVDRLLLRQHHRRKIDDMVQLLLKPSWVATQKQLSHNVLYWWETPPRCAAQSLRRWMMECQLSVCRHGSIICFIFQSFFDRPLTPVTASDRGRGWALMFVLNMLLSLGSCLRF